MGVIIMKLNGRKDLSATVDENDYRTLNLSSYKWYPIPGKRTTYAYSHKKGKTIYLHRFIMGLENAPRSVFVDHIDHNGLNNSRTNIRVTNNSNNQRNSRKRLSAKCTSVYKGVSNSSHNKMKPWKATVSLTIGCYRTETEAAIAYNQAITKLFGPNALLNELPDQK